MIDNNKGHINNQQTANTEDATASEEKNQNTIQAPAISLPSGGGAIRGIDEKFSVNAVNGTATFSIPLPFASGRGASPSLNLSYNSGAGNGVFGLGWTINLPSIKRKTAKGLPTYKDAHDADTFLFSEAEDLVPEFKKANDGSFLKDTKGRFIIHEETSADNLFIIRYYRPRIESLFARIERWTEKASGRIKWRMITKENVTTLFGWTDNAVISNPANAALIFEWLPEFVFDSKGHCSHYQYKQEDQVGFDLAQLHHRNRLRNGKLLYTNRYLDTVLYGNIAPYPGFGQNFPGPSGYMFQTVFDYGSQNKTDPPEQLKPWDFRQDAFSDYRSGFEIRTTRLCKRVLQFHIFEELAVKADKSDKKTLVKSLDFTYDTGSEQDFTFLAKITSRSYQKKSDGSYVQRQLPPVEFSYQKHEWSREVRSIESEDLVHAPFGGHAPGFQFIDLFNEGLPGILTEQAGGWYYKHNLGGGTFEQARQVAPKPSFTGLGSDLQLIDLDADGGKQLVNLKTEPKGFYELDTTARWQYLKEFDALPNIDLGDPNTRMFDLTGDGKPDIVVTEENAFTWYASRGKKGYTEAQTSPKAFDEEEGPFMVFADATQSIFLADMSGDGLTDILRIRNGEVCYWPNLGYGRFGRKISMDNAPLFDHTDTFNPSYLKLADIDGSGTADIIYLGKNKFSCWKNLSGNRFDTVPFEIESFPEIHSNTTITVADILGNGVSCIVWSSTLQKDAGQSTRYIDLMSGKKPHVMVGYKNNMGKEVTLEYTPSTYFYLQDKQAGKPWVTRLHFPVHVLSKTVTIDIWRKTRFTKQFTYHHGYYDSAEREFRGFGRVEQTDIEDYGSFASANLNSPYITDDLTLYQPPVKTITWYHTGAFLEESRILDQFKTEYYSPKSVNFQEKPFTATELDTQMLSGKEWQEALRACKGMPLRQEIYELDVRALAQGDEQRIKLYSTAFHNCKVRLLQPDGNNRHAVFYSTEGESITYHYELDLTTGTLNPDPRISHIFNLKHDEVGNTLESLAITYPRIGQHQDASLTSAHLNLIRKVQKESMILFSTHSFSNDIKEANSYRLRMPVESKTYEITGLSPLTGSYLTLEQIKSLQIADVVKEIPYHQLPGSGEVQKRCIAHNRILYFANDLVNPLPWGQQNKWGLTFESYTLALTDALLLEIFTPEQLNPEVRAHLNDPDYSGYLSGAKLQQRFPDMDTSGLYWLRSGIEGFDANASAHFYTPKRFVDSFGSTTQITYDIKTLFITASTDPEGNTTRVEQYDYRVLSASKMVDTNDNISEVRYDILGMPTAMALAGKRTEGDKLDAFDSALLNPDLNFSISYFTQPYDEARSRQQLATATSRNLYYFGERIEADGSISYGHHPACASGILREKHLAAVTTTQSPVQVSFEYSDGSGKQMVTKKQAEPASTGGPLRWLTNGKTVLNNKGNPVKQYEPYFSSVGHQFEEPLEEGVTPLFFYDAMGRQIRTEMPDGTLLKSDFSPWYCKKYDANDTVLEPNNSWYQRNLTGTAAQQRAANSAALHADTPTVVFLDSQAREVITLIHNSFEQGGSLQNEKYLTWSKLDAEGKPLWIQDARGNRVMEYISNPGASTGYAPCYDLAGNLLFQHSMDAGSRWTLMDSTAKPFYAWDKNSYQSNTGTVEEKRVYHTTYDRLRRPLETRLKINAGSWKVIERMQYGEGVVNAKAKNLKGHLYQHDHAAGSQRYTHYDFKGNLLETTKQLTATFDVEVIDWNTATLSSEVFIQRTQYDAVNRMTHLENWHLTGSNPTTYKPAYNERGLLKSEMHTLNGLGVDAVKNIEYDAKGQRTRMQYGNGTTTRYFYDPFTFRLQQLRTTKTGTGGSLPNPPSNRTDANVLQNLYYSYDPSGNITEVLDDAFEPVFFNGQLVEARSKYTYDAAYRLIKAEGRENNNFNEAPKGGKLAAIPLITFPVSDPSASQNYLQEYKYDEAGNMIQMRHRAGVGSLTQRWTRVNTYATNSNRLLTTQTGSSPSQQINFAYDTHGSIRNLGNAPDAYTMQWDHRDMVHTADLGGGGRVWYQYDSKKQRHRKRIQRLDGTVEERIYLGGMERYRRWNGANLQEEIETHHLFVGEQRVLIVENVIITNNPQLSTGILYRYQYNNHVGSVALEMSGGSNPQIISYEEYHPYGTTAYAAKNASIQATAKRYKYTGMERDEETGMAYHKARYYLPWLGRWLSADPIGVKDGLNVFQYVRNKPIGLADRSGLQTSVLEEEGTLYAEMFGPLIEFFIGGNWDIHQTEEPQMPEGGVGGVVGGVADTVTLRQTGVLEDYPSQTSMMGMETGARMVPVVDPALRLVTGETVTGMTADPDEAALDLFLDAALLGLEGAAIRSEMQGARVLATMDRRIARVERQMMRTESNVVDVAQMERDALLAERERLVRLLHKRELGLDQHRGRPEEPSTQWQPREAETAANLEARTGRRLRRARRDEVGDWVDASPTSGRTYDAVGPVPAEHFDRVSFTNQITGHLQKQGLDRVVVDLSGLADNSVRDVRAFVESLDQASQARIIMIY
ncbi:SpvB/TcaC N-terminal domain-containing protein [Flavobacteriaceae bacterium M23B6Z8]